MTRIESISRSWQFETPIIDAGYPEWARRSNPIVRRHLGIYIKTIPPSFRVLLTLFLTQALLALLSIGIPLFFTLVVVMMIVSFMVLPVGWYFFAQAAIFTARDAAANMQKEKDNTMLALLRTTPLKLRDILLGKVAAAIWRQVQDINLVLVIAIFFSLPPIMILFADRFPLAQGSYLYPLAIILVLGASVLRVILELFMIGSLGVMAGTIVPVHSGATVVALGLAFFYFLIINLIRFLPTTLPMQIVAEAVLPVVMPIAISLLALRMAERSITRD